MAVDLVTEFRNDHRFVVRSLISLQKALSENRLPEAREIVERLDGAVGPHFKFEEEDLYPALAQAFVGQKRVGELLGYHDGAVKIVRGLRELLSKETLSPREREEAAENLTAFFVHASDCDGLNLLVEQLEEGERARLAERLLAARGTAIPLTQLRD